MLRCAEVHWCRVDGEVGRCRGDRAAGAFTVVQVREDAARTRKVTEKMMGTG